MSSDVRLRGIPMCIELERDVNKTLDAIREKWA